ncbi:MAG: exosortase H [Thermoanaerobaculia bacterium]
MTGSLPSRSPGRFLGMFALFLVVFYFAVAVRPVNDHVVVPFTGFVARVSGSLLRALGEPAVVSGTVVASGKFSVNIENGCNGLETALLLAAAVLAFPATWRQRAAGFFLGFFAIEVVNLLRVASLFWIGVHRPEWFGSAHTLVWQTVVVLFGVGFFVAWAGRVSKSAHVGKRSPV